VIVAAAVLGVFAIYQYRKGAALDRGWNWIKKEDRPSAFWTIVAGQSLLAVVLVAIFALHIIRY
jgi:hypothetical protein